MQPWGVVSWHGHWYLAGHDEDRGEMRVFRLSRIRGPVQAAGPPGIVVRPAHLDIRAEVVRKATQIAEGEGAERVARLRVRPGAAHALRRRASAGARAAGGMAPDERDPGSASDDAEVIEVAFTDLERMAAQVLWHGPDVVVIEPSELRDHVLDRLQAWPLQRCGRDRRGRPAAAVAGPGALAAAPPEQPGRRRRRTFRNNRKAADR